MKDKSDDDRVDAEFDLSESESEVEGDPSESTDDNPTGQRVHTLLPDPEGLLRELAEREEAGGGFPDQMAEFMAQPGMQDAVERARWGTVRVQSLLAGTALLCMVHRDEPTSWIIQALPDHVNLPPDINTRYQIRYGSGGAMRTSGLLLPGMWICHGSDVQVIGLTTNIGNPLAGVAAFITPAPGAIPNIP